MADEVCCYLHVSWLFLHVTGSDHAQPTLLDHLTALVLVGDPSGYPHATRPRAGRPLCGLLDAVHAGVPGINAHRLLLSVGYGTQSKRLLVSIMHFQQLCLGKQC